MSESLREEEVSIVPPEIYQPVGAVDKLLNKGIIKKENTAQFEDTLSVKVTPELISILKPEQSDIIPEFLEVSKVIPEDEVVTALEKNIVGMPKYYKSDIEKETSFDITKSSLVSLTQKSIFSITPLHYESFATETGVNVLISEVKEATRQIKEEIKELKPDLTPTPDGSESVLPMSNTIKFCESSELDDIKSLQIVGYKYKSSRDSLNNSESSSIYSDMTPIPISNADIKLHDSSKSFGSGKQPVALGDISYDIKKVHASNEFDKESIFNENLPAQPILTSHSVFGVSSEDIVMTDDILKVTLTEDNGDMQDCKTEGKILKTKSGTTYVELDSCDKKSICFCEDVISSVSLSFAPQPSTSFSEKVDEDAVSDYSGDVSKENKCHDFHSDKNNKERYSKVISVDKQNKLSAYDINLGTRKIDDRASTPHKVRIDKTSPFTIPTGAISKYETRHKGYMASTLSRDLKVEHSVAERNAYFSRESSLKRHISDRDESTSSSSSPTKSFSQKKPLDVTENIIMFSKSPKKVMTKKLQSKLLEDTISSSDAAMAKPLLLKDKTPTTIKKNTKSKILKEEDSSITGKYMSKRASSTKSEQTDTLESTAVPSLMSQKVTTKSTLSRKIAFSHHESTSIRESSTSSSRQLNGYVSKPEDVGISVERGRPRKRDELTKTSRQIKSNSKKEQSFSMPDTSASDHPKKYVSKEVASILPITVKQKYPNINTIHAPYYIPTQDNPKSPESPLDPEICLPTPVANIPSPDPSPSVKSVLDKSITIATERKTMIERRMSPSPSASPVKSVARSDRYTSAVDLSQSSPSLPSSPSRVRGQQQSGVTQLLTSEVFTRTVDASGSIEVIYRQPTVSEALRRVAVASGTRSVLESVFVPGETEVSLIDTTDSSLSDSVALPSSSSDHDLSIDTNVRVRGTSASPKHTRRSLDLIHDTPGSKLRNSDLLLEYSTVVEDQTVHSIEPLIQKKETSSDSVAVPKYSSKVSPTKPSKQPSPLKSSQVSEERLSPILDVRAVTPPRVKHKFDYMEEETSSDAAFPSSPGKTEPPTFSSGSSSFDPPSVAASVQSMASELDQLLEEVQINMGIDSHWDSKSVLHRGDTYMNVPHRDLADPLLSDYVHSQDRSNGEIFLTSSLRKTPRTVLPAPEKTSVAPFNEDASFQHNVVRFSAAIDPNDYLISEEEDLFDLGEDDIHTLSPSGSELDYAVVEPHNQLAAIEEEAAATDEDQDIIPIDDTPLHQNSDAHLSEESNCSESPKSCRGVFITNMALKESKVPLISITSDDTFGDDSLDYHHKPVPSDILTDMEDLDSDLEDAKHKITPVLNSLVITEGELSGLTDTEYIHTSDEDDNYESSMRPKTPIPLDNLLDFQSTLEECVIINSPNKNDNILKSEISRSAQGPASANTFLGFSLPDTKEGLTDLEDFGLSGEDEPPDISEEIFEENDFLTGLICDGENVDIADRIKTIVQTSPSPPSTPERRQVKDKNVRIRRRKVSPKKSHAIENKYSQYLSPSPSSVLFSDNTDVESLPSDSEDEEKRDKRKT
ncbi:unnamed protein product, partial [Timema podura]|nr:unnamed protein product [Timema podura]